MSVLWTHEKKNWRNGTIEKLPYIYKKNHPNQVYRSIITGEECKHMKERPRISHGLEFLGENKKYVTTNASESGCLCFTNSKSSLACRAKNLNTWFAFA